MYLGIDLGTSGVKLLLMNEQHSLLATADAPLTVQRPQPLWSEQDPADWWNAVLKAVAELRSLHPKAWAQIRAIGLSGQMHGAVVLNERMQVLRPAILWNDGRSSKECVLLEARAPRSRQITGNLAMPGFTAPKLLWLREHEPDTFNRTQCVLLPKDWLRLQLCGEAVSDMSDASGTLWLDVGARGWSDEMLSACGLHLSHMPRLIEGSDVSGQLLPTIAREWGLSPTVVVAGGAGDNAASAVGVGAVQPGQGFVSLGTSGVIFRIGKAFEPAPDLAVHAFAHALPGQWHQMAVMLSAASAFRWLAELTGQDMTSNDLRGSWESRLSLAVDALDDRRRRQAPLFLPYLNGERTPLNNPHLKASFIGLSAEHEAPDLAYAVMQGVTLGLMDGWHAMGQQTATSTSLALVGGGARSNTWAQMLASGLQCPLHRSPQAAVAAALGAARLAGLADGKLTQTSISERPVDNLPTLACFEPQAGETQHLLARHAQFKALQQSAQMNLD